MSARTETALLAGGCFWGMQELIRAMPGVVSTRVGYSGGDVPNATYRNHGTHAEAIEIVFDPDKLSYREMQTLELYVDVMRKRFEDRLRIDMRVDPDVRLALVPHLLLQPLVENALKHGANPASNDVDVTVRAERDGGHTRVRIRDRGRGLSNGGMRRGTGIANTVERLERLYGAEHSLAFENCDDGGLAVTVAVPYRTTLG